jgi:hypothetical protein
LNLKTWKAELGVPVEWSAVTAIILGIAAGSQPTPAHKPAEIVSWRESVV